MHDKRRERLLAATPLGRAVLGVAGHGPDAAEFAWDEGRRQRDAHGRWTAGGAGVNTSSALQKAADASADGRQLAGMLGEAMLLGKDGTEDKGTDNPFGTHIFTLRAAADKLEDMGLHVTAAAVHAVVKAAEDQANGRGVQTNTVDRATADRLNPMLAAAHRELAAHGVSVAMPNLLNISGRNNVTVADAGTGRVAVRTNGKLVSRPADTDYARLDRHGTAGPSRTSAAVAEGQKAGPAALASLSPAALAALLLHKAVTIADGSERIQRSVDTPGLLRGTQRKRDGGSRPDLADSATHLNAVNYGTWQGYHLGGRLQSGTPVHNADGTSTLTTDLNSGGKKLATITAVQGKGGHEAIDNASLDNAAGPGQNTRHDLVGAAVAQASLRGAQAVSLTLPASWTRETPHTELTHALNALVEYGLATVKPAAQTPAEKRRGMEAGKTVVEIHAPAAAAHQLLSREFNGEGDGDSLFRNARRPQADAPGAYAANALLELGLAPHAHAGVTTRVDYMGPRVYNTVPGVTDGNGQPLVRPSREKLATLKQEPGTTHATLEIKPPTALSGLQHAGGVSAASAAQATLTVAAHALHEAGLKRLTQVTVAAKKKDADFDALVKAKLAKRTKGAYTVTEPLKAAAFLEGRIKVDVARSEEGD